MKRIKFEELKHMDMIYYVRGIMDHGKIRIISEVRYAQNPENEFNYVWTYLMTGSGNDPCLKIKKEHIAICVERDKQIKSKTYDFQRSEFKRIFVYDKFSESGKKGGKKSKRKLSKEEASRMGKLSAEKRKKRKEQEKLSDT